ncbi:hypothetical protein EMPS_05869 [Entomortierella parvispora]|uniref:Uncharacterized protein n=1 Tax=Entomortierella parvispora TaxID=205924 RepID=A0A9P3LWQ0_9FUNG|nr:hypothetical protein EMPS_05869 [Entomortierella parvispora]
MAMPARKLYWITAAIFLAVVFLSYHKSNSYNDYNDSTSYVDPSTSRNKDPSNPYEYSNPGTGSSKGNTGSQYNEDKTTDDYSEKTEDPKDTSVNLPKDTTTTPSTTTNTPPPEPNTSGQYDTLVVIPSSWTQIQNRRWVRETIFGIKNNLEPCKLYDGRIIYKFYIHGRSTWGKTKIHSAEYMQAQVRDLYGELVEFNDSMFANKTIAPHSVWGDALDWAVNTFVPQEKIKVDKIAIFDSTTIVNLPKMEQTVKGAVNPNGFVYTWGEPRTWAAMVSFSVAQKLLENRAVIESEREVPLNLIDATKIYFTAPSFKQEKGKGQLWASEVEKIDVSTEVVGQVYQQEDWMPIADHLAIQPTAACAVDVNRKKNVAVLTSSYIYVDMCMAEASLYAAENKRLYAEKHGYDFVARAAEFAQEEFRGRRLVWGKIGALQKVLPHYEWLFWMDMDAVVADMDKDVRELLKFAEENKRPEQDEISLVVVRPVRDPKLNAGVLLIKNTDWSRRFLNEVQTRTEWYAKSSYEQAAIWDVMMDPQWTSGVYLYDKNDHVMNTFPKQYEEGDFIIHFAPAGCPAVPVLEALRKVKNGESVKGVGIDY